MRGKHPDSDAEVAGAMNELADSLDENARAQEEMAEAEDERAKAEREQAEAEHEQANAEKNKKKTPFLKREVLPADGHVRRTARAVNNFVSPFVNAPVSLYSGLKSHVQNHGLKWLLLFVFLLHWFDVLTHFNRTGVWASVWAVLYALLALVIAPFLANGGFRGYLSGNTIIFFVLSVLSWFFPKFLSLLPKTIVSNPYFVFVLFLTPVWGAFLMFYIADDPLVNKIRGVWLFIWIVILVFTLIGFLGKTTVPSQLQGSFKIDVWTAISTVWHDLTDNMAAIFKRVASVPDLASNFINKNLNDTLGLSYSGTVDEYSHQDLGVHFKDMRAQDKRFFVGTPVVVWTNIQGEAFNDNIILDLSCFAVNSKGDQIKGVVNAQGLQSITRAGVVKKYLNITRKQVVSASCTFDNLPKGFYDVYFYGIFNFETWAYIPYYFAPYEMINTLWEQDQDPAFYFGIDSNSVAKYNPGPVMLGLANDFDQPIPLWAKDGFVSRFLPSFGASVTNSWVEGEVVYVESLQLLVPPPFKLKACDRVPKSGSKADPGFEVDPNTNYRVYEFLNSANPNSLFQSVTCLLSLNGVDDVNSVLQNFDLVQKTFVGKAKYLYSIKDSIRIEVS